MRPTQQMVASPVAARLSGLELESDRWRERPCKPGSVPAPEGPGDSHFSGTSVAARLERPTRKDMDASRAAGPSLFGLSPGGVCRSAPVSGGAGALLPHRFTLTIDRANPVHSAVYSLLHFPWPCGRLPLTTTMARGARTFLPGVNPRVPPERLSQPLAPSGMISRPRHCGRPERPTS